MGVVSWCICAINFMSDHSTEPRNLTKGHTSGQQRECVYSYTLVYAASADV